MENYWTTEEIIAGELMLTENNLKSNGKVLTYEHELEYLVDSKSWNEIHNLFIVDSIVELDSSNFYVDTNRHLEKYFVEKIQEILGRSYEFMGEFRTMVEWIESNLPEWLLEEIKDIIEEAKREFTASEGLANWKDVG